MHKITTSEYILNRLGGKTPLQLQFIEHLHSITSAKFYCAGGCIRSIFSGEELTDIDLFPTSEDEYEKLHQKCIEAYTIKREKENDYNISLTLEFKTSIENEKGEELEEVHELEVQIVKIYHEKVEDLIHSFDFTICMFAYDRANDQFILGENSMEDLIKKRLVINEVTYHLSTLRRFFKYANKGFYACSGCLKTYILSIRSSENDDLDKEPEYID